MMRTIQILAVLALAAGGCGDNDKPQDVSFTSPAGAGGASSVAGSQVAHSKSFTLVTNVSAAHQTPAQSASFKMTPAMGGAQ
jgi:hypothetical protein